MKIRTEGKLGTNRHKTGHLHDVMITVQDDQYPWLKRQKEQFRKEFKNDSSLVFASPANTIEHSVPRYLRETIRGLFRDLPKESLDKDFHSNSVRKMWDTFINDHRDSIPESLRNLHLRQTGHSESTAQGNYIVPGELNPTLQLYTQKLNEDAHDGEKMSQLRTKCQ